MSENTFGSFKISLRRRSISLVELGLPAGQADCCSTVCGATSNAIRHTPEQDFVKTYTRAREGGREGGWCLRLMMAEI